MGTLSAMREEAYDLAEVLHGRSLVIASNRGPVTFERDEAGQLIGRRGAGGLVTALSQVMRHASGVWVASAMSALDREMVRLRGDEHLEVPLDGYPLRLRYLTFDRETFDRYYNGIANSTFWFMQHSLWNLALQPDFRRWTRDAWEAYHAVNRRFAEAVAEEVSGSEDLSPVMLNDYHLMLVAGYLRDLLPEAFSYHFTHSPWAQPETMRILPERMARETLEGMLANDLLGFQCDRWARNFMLCCQELLGAEVDYGRGAVRHGDRETAVRHYPISTDVETVRALATSAEASRHRVWLAQLLGDRRLIVRVDRIEPAKNIVRGFRAYEEFLHENPEWRGRVVHLALLYPSRRGLYAYRTYEAEVLDLHDRINGELGTDDWQPIVLVNEDDYVRALACLGRYDVLIVNPIADGMNLVSKEGPAVNESDGVLVLSRNTGSWYELGEAALSINPYDISETAEAIRAALTMEPEERRRRAAVLQGVVESSTPAKWAWRQLRDIRRLHES